MNDRFWYTADNIPIDDIKAVVRQMAAETRVFHIGTDAQKHGIKTEYVSVICALLPGKGGRVFYSRVKEKRVASLREKLYKEVWFSIEVGLMLNEVIPANTEVIVHVDANPNVKFKSSSYVKELAGMVVGQGFQAVLKPDAWAASHAADQIVKYRNPDRFAA